MGLRLEHDSMGTRKGRNGNDGHDGHDGLVWNETRDGCAGVALAWHEAGTLNRPSERARWEYVAFCPSNTPTFLKHLGSMSE